MRKNKIFYDFCFITAAIIYYYDKGFQNQNVNMLVGVALVMIIVNRTWDFVNSKK